MGSKRGGKKTKRKQELWDATERGEHVPKAKCSSLPHRVQAGIESGDLVIVDGSTAASSSVAVPAAKPVSPVFPVEAFSVRAVPKAKVSVEAFSVGSVPKAKSASEVPEPKVPPKAPPKDCFKEPVEFVTEGPCQAGDPEHSEAKEVVLLGRNPRKETGTLSTQAFVLRPNPGNPASTVREVVRGEVRVSLDFHGVVQGYDNRVPPENLKAIEEFLVDSTHNQVGICSFIGQYGNRSQSRRQEVKEIVLAFRARSGLNLGLCITTDKSKRDIDGFVHCHIDDRVDTCLGVVSRGGVAILISDRPHPTLETHRSLPLALQAIRTRFVPKEFTAVWPGPFSSV